MNIIVRNLPDFFHSRVLLTIPVERGSNLQLSLDI